jgi:8-oxo-dGTP pyrophosphatase MutT (NUDIX family)
MRQFDWCYRLAYRLAYPIMNRWWHFSGHHHGVKVAVWLGDRVLCVRHSYKPGLQLPAGGVGKGENHRLTAARELEEETGVVIDQRDLRLVFALSTAMGMLYLYEARIDARPPLRIDHREIIGAEFVPTNLLVDPTPRVLAYLAETANMAVAVDQER